MTVTAVGWNGRERSHRPRGAIRCELVMVSIGSGPRLSRRSRAGNLLGHRNTARSEAAGSGGTCRSSAPGDRGSRPGMVPM